MANPDQLGILKQGVEAWNQWRSEHRGELPDLSHANLRDAHLNGAYLLVTNLNGADLTNTDLSRAVLDAADLSGAVLTRAVLRDAHIVRTNLSHADLRGADLSSAYISSVDLRGADLRGAVLGTTYLLNADLSGAHLDSALLMLPVFGNIDLSSVKGLEMVRHEGPSIIGIDTIYRSKGRIPEGFLKKAGVPNSFIEYMHSLVGKAIDYYTCFISYSSKDDAFAQRLYADLQSNNVRCWFAPEDLKWGERIRSGIDEAIRLHDKLLLILSKHSVASGWVEREVKTALAKERKEKRTVLVPIRVDNAVLECPFAWATEIRHERNMGDFTKWKNHDEYQKAFTRLLPDLKAEAKKAKEP